jgi:hypothetical protein
MNKIIIILISTIFIFLNCKKEEEIIWYKITKGKHSYITSYYSNYNGTNCIYFYLQNNQEMNFCGDFRIEEIK